MKKQFWAFCDRRGSHPMLLARKIAENTKYYLLINFFTGY